MQSPYQLIKRSITDGIAAGFWQVGEILPSEHALCRRFSVSRMTVNRAMRELAQENLIRRVPGKGSYVADTIAQSGLVQIRSIADEIAARGGKHYARVLTLEAVEAPATISHHLQAQRVFHSLILHFEDDAPLQIEDRFVSPVAAPGYLDQDFTLTTPNEFLARVAPLGAAEHSVQALPASAEAALLLEIPPGTPCLVVQRKTWSAGRPVSAATLTHPGNRFRLQGEFNAEE
jgi:GntR family histidine utilization transcriptional repressor